MAQILKHRRGRIEDIAAATANRGEFVITTGSIGTISGPFIFIGETDGVSGAFRASNRIFRGTTVPNLTTNTYGSTLNDTLFYSSTDRTLTLLSNAGNTTLDLSGNILGSTLASLTVTTLSATTLNVGSSLNITGNTIQTGSLSLTGNFTNSGDVTFNGQINSHLIPKTNNTFDLGSTTNAWRNLFVSGSSTLNTLTTRGAATLASATVQNLTQNGIVVAGSGGALTTPAGFNFDGTTLRFGAGRFEVDSGTGNIRTSGSITATGGFTSNGSLTVNGALVVTGQTTLQSNLIVSGNLTVFGSATNLTIQSQTVEIDDNIIRLNAFAPFQRYGGIEVMDSGSVSSASLLHDSQNDYWLYVNPSGQSGRIISTTMGALGSETSLNTGLIPIATGPDSLGDSSIRISGTTLSVNTNRFTVDTTSGNVFISGSLTLNVGGADSNTKTSRIVFRNNSGVLGFVSNTETQDVTDGLLGYRSSDGALVFSTVVDGGTI